jgi:hypothetical protein
MGEVLWKIVANVLQTAIGRVGFQLARRRSVLIWGLFSAVHPLNKQCAATT